MIVVAMFNDPRVHWAHRYSSITACGINKGWTTQHDGVPTCLVCVSRLE